MDDKDHPLSHSYVIRDVAMTLAECLTLSAQLTGYEANPLSQAEKLFKSLTGLAAIPALTPDEMNYVRKKLVYTAAITIPKRPLPRREISHEAEVLFNLAREMHLVMPEMERRGAADKLN